jgi:error-prone DNA polymerase
MAHVRGWLGPEVLTSEQLLSSLDGETVTVAGMVIRRQRPLAKAVFITLEDEFGHIPLIAWTKTYERLNAALKEPFVIATGAVSRREGTLNVVVQHAKSLRVLEDVPPSRDFR